MNKINLPIIRNVSSVTMAELCSVQPMTDDSPNIFKTKITTDSPLPKHGMIRHSFTEGWQRFYHGEWISDKLWWKLKIAGLE